MGVDSDHRCEAEMPRGCASSFEAGFVSNNEHDAEMPRGHDAVHSGENSNDQHRNQDAPDGCALPCIYFQAGADSIDQPRNQDATRLSIISKRALIQTTSVKQRCHAAVHPVLSARDLIRKPGCRAAERSFPSGRGLKQPV